MYEIGVKKITHASKDGEIKMHTISQIVDNTLLLDNTSKTMQIFLVTIIGFSSKTSHFLTTNYVSSTIFPFFATKPKSSFVSHKPAPIHQHKTALDVLVYLI